MHESVALTERKRKAVLFFFPTWLRIKRIFKTAVTLKVSIARTEVLSETCAVAKKKEVKACIRSQDVDIERGGNIIICQAPHLGSHNDSSKRLGSC